MAQSITEVGSFLAEARQSLKPQRLFLTWLDVTGFPRRTAYNYLKLIETFKEELPSYSHLGVKKLLAASRLPDGIDFVRENERELCAMSVAEVEQKVKDTKGKKRKGKGGRRPQFEQIGKFRIRISTDETKIVVENLDKHTKGKILSAVKDILSQRK